MTDNLIIFPMIMLGSVFLGSGLTVVSLVTPQGNRENLILAGFLFTLTVWSLGQIMPTFNLAAGDQTAKIIFYLLPFCGATFLHLGLKLSGLQQKKIWIGAYVVAFILTFIAAFTSNGNYLLWQGVKGLEVDFNLVWSPVSVSLFMLVSVLILFFSGKTPNRQKNHQNRAFMFLGMAGCLLFMGFFLELNNLKLIYFYLAWPAFILLSTYSLYRYNCHAANQWAVGSIAFICSVAFIAIVYKLFTYVLELSYESSLDSFGWRSMVVFSLAVLLAYVVKAWILKFAYSVVYLKSTMDKKLAKNWQKEIKDADDLSSLRTVVQDLASKYLGQFVGVQFSTLTDYAIISEPRITFRNDSSGWKAYLEGWDFAEPGHIDGGETLCGVVLQHLSQLNQNSGNGEKQESISEEFVQQMLDKAKTLYKVIRANSKKEKITSEQLAPFENLDCKELQPFKSLINLEIIDFHSKGLITELIRTHREFKVEIVKLGDDVEITADPDRFKEILLHSFSILKSDGIELSLSVEEQMQKISIRARISKEPNEHPGDQQKMETITNWLKIIQLTDSHGVLFDYHVEKDKRVLEFAFPVKLDKKKQAQA